MLHIEISKQPIGSAATRAANHLRVVNKLRETRLADRAENLVAQHGRVALVAVPVPVAGSVIAEVQVLVRAVASVTVATSVEAVAWVIVVVFLEAIELVTGVSAIAQPIAARLVGSIVAVRAAASVADLRAWGVEVA